MLRTFASRHAISTDSSKILCFKGSARQYSSKLSNTDISIPVWRTVSAYFVTLELMEEPLPDYVRYRFSFWEDSTASGGLVEVSVEGEPEGGTDPEIPAGGWGAVHTVRKGETLWGIAWRYGVALTALIAANPQIKNPNLIYPGDQVRIP